MVTRYAVNWDNGASACGTFAERFDTQAEAQAWADAWAFERNLDEEQPDGEGCYTAEVIEIEINDEENPGETPGICPVCARAIGRDENICPACADKVTACVAERGYEREDAIDFLIEHPDWQADVPGPCMTCGTQCDDEGICPVCAALERAVEAAREAEAFGTGKAAAERALSKARRAPVTSCRKCGAAIVLRDILCGAACVDFGEGPEAGKVFVYCSHHCMETH